MLELLDYGSLTLILEFVDLGIVTGMLRSWNRKSGVWNLWISEEWLEFLLF